MGLMSGYSPNDQAPKIELRPPEQSDMGRTAAAVTLAQDLAAVLDTPIENTWWSLCNAPLEMVGLLDTPQGWAAYAGYIANDLGHPTPEYSPEVH